MGVINRSAVVVQPRQAFLEWRNSFELKEGRSPYTLERVREDPKVYLVSVFRNQAHVQETVLEDFDLIFIDQLVGTCTVEDEWPRNRTVEMFKEWFDITVYAWVDDTVDEDIFDEET